MISVLYLPNLAPLQWWFVQITCACFICIYKYLYIILIAVFQCPAISTYSLTAWTNQKIIQRVWYCRYRISMKWNPCPWTNFWNHPRFQQAQLSSDLAFSMIQIIMAPNAKLSPSRQTFVFCVYFQTQSWSYLELFVFKGVMGFRICIHMNKVISPKYELTEKSGDL